MMYLRRWLLPDKRVYFFGLPVKVAWEVIGGDDDPREPIPEEYYRTWLFLEVSAAFEGV